MLAGVVLAHVSYAADVLPPPDPPFKGKIGPTVTESVPNWPELPRAPQGAPNIVLILLDDVGYAATDTFGGPVQTPALDQLSARGLRYNRFHVAAQCSPTRAALLSGRNDHRVGFGAVGEGGYPGYNTIWPKDTASIAAVLKDSGYSTAAFGKWHNTPEWEISPVGPFDRWPTGLGFEYFYGFMAGADSQYEPALYRNTSPIDPPATPAQGYHLTTDITDEAIAWVHTHQSLAPQKPYFVYFAPGATHGPHHVAEKWIEPYRGSFDLGWDRLREEIFARQKKLGVIPSDAALTPRPKDLPAWKSLPIEERELLARQMEVYAGFLAHTDYEVGRLLQAVQEGSSGNNTLILYIAGDNGASSEAGLTGTDGIIKETVHERLKHVTELGGVLHLNQYAAGWAWALSTPFQWQKLIASHLGGTRDPLIVSWPAKIASPGAVRDQYLHVNDVAATLYEAAGITFPSIVDGAKQIPLDGVSFASSFVQANAPSSHTTQVYEQWGNRAIYHDGWLASARHNVPWVSDKLFTDYDYDRDQWELYDLNQDFSQAHDVAAHDPKRLQELKALFDSEARRNNIYPLGGADYRGAPISTADRSEFIYYPSLPRLPSAQAPDFSRSHVITADIVVPNTGAEGVIVSNGGRYEGFVLYMKDDRVIYEHNVDGWLETLTSNSAVPRGRLQVVFRFTAESRSSNTLFNEASGLGQLYVNGTEVGSSSIEHMYSAPYFMLFSTFDIGQARVSPVSRHFDMPFKFTGSLEKVRIELK
jgi:arylsulfatase A-like enzyme